MIGSKPEQNTRLPLSLQWNTIDFPATDSGFNRASQSFPQCFEAMVPSILILPSESGFAIPNLPLKSPTSQLK